MTFVPSGSTFVSDMAMNGKKRYVCIERDNAVLLYTQDNHRWVNDDQPHIIFPRLHPDISDCIFLASTSFHRNNHKNIQFIHKNAPSCPPPFPRLCPQTSICCSCPCPRRCQVHQLQSRFYSRCRCGRLPCSRGYRWFPPERKL